MSRESTFVKGAAILAISGVLIKFIGAAMRIILAALMGDEGIGLYQMAYPVYATLLAVSTAGIPVAVSKLMAENIAYRDYRGAFKVYQLSLAILTITGVFITFFLAGGARFFAENVAKNPDAFMPILAISPAIFFVTIMSALRGFFQGQQSMTPTALSQLVEQLVRVATSISLAALFLPVGLEFAATGAVFGAVAGGAAGLMVLVIIYYRQKPQYLKKMQSQSRLSRHGVKDTVFRIAALSAPITIGSLMVPLTNLIDLSIVPLRLHHAGFDTARATALYGQLTGMAASIINFPVVLTLSLSISLVPAISEAYALKNRLLLQDRIKIAQRLSLLVSLPSAAGLFILSRPITMLLFNNEEAAYPLSVISWGIIFLSLYLTSTGVLQGMGFTMIPVKNMFYGALVKIILSWYLTAVPAFHIGGAALATVVGFLVTAFLNMRQVSHLTGLRINLLIMMAKPVLATAVMLLAVHFSYELIYALTNDYFSDKYANLSATFISIVAGAAFYLAALLLSRTVMEKDLKMIPYVGDRLAALAKRLRLM